MISAFDASQQSVDEYCPGSGIAVSGFDTWRKHFQEEPSSQDASAFIPITRHAEIHRPRE